MHTYPKLEDWSVTAKDSNCVEIQINEDLSLEGIKIKVLSDTRSLLLAFEPTSRKVNWCIYTGNPMFIELHTPAGVSVKYVENSGGEYYHNQN